MTKVAIQGQNLSFHDQAARSFFGNDIEIIPSQSFKQAFLSLADKKADFALVAIENSLFGSINEVYDLLLKYRFWICGEVRLKVSHCLIGLPNSSLDQIKEVHSHPVALAQCDVYLDTNLPNADRFEHHDTAGSVADVKEWNDPAKAAIASHKAAEFYGLKVLAKAIETHHQNYTRFVILEREKSDKSPLNKTSLVIKTADKPGALYNAIGAFANNGINLTKLQSRPIVGNAWHYMFYIDVDASIANTAFKKSLDQLKEQDCETIILGSYKSDKI